MHVLGTFAKDYVEIGWVYFFVLQFCVTSKKKGKLHRELADLWDILIRVILLNTTTSAVMSNLNEYNIIYLTNLDLSSLFLCQNPSLPPS